MAVTEQSSPTPTQESKEILAQETLRVGPFYQAVEEVTFAAGSSDERPLLRGTVLYFKENGLEMVALDGHRLSWARIDREADSSNLPPELIVPANVLNGACKLLFDKRVKLEKAVLSVLPGKLEIESGSSHVSVAMPLINKDRNPYPKWEPLVPRQVGGATFDRRELLDALKPVKHLQAVGVSTTKDSPGKLIIKKRYETENRIPKDSRDELSEIAAIGELHSGVTLKAPFLLDVLRSVSSVKELSLETTTSAAVAAFRKPNDENYLHIIMPMYFNWD